MQKAKQSEDKKWPSGYDEHRKAQIIRWATESTPAERLQFVEEALEFFDKRTPIKN